MGRPTNHVGTKGMVTSHFRANRLHPTHRASPTSLLLFPIIPSHSRDHHEHQRRLLFLRPCGRSTVAIPGPLRRSPRHEEDDDSFPPEEKDEDTRSAALSFRNRLRAAPDFGRCPTPPAVRPQQRPPSLSRSSPILAESAPLGSLSKRSLLLQTWLMLSPDHLHRHHARGLSHLGPVPRISLLRQERVPERAPLAAPLPSQEYRSRVDARYDGAASLLPYQPPTRPLSDTGSPVLGESVVLFP